MRILDFVLGFGSYGLEFGVQNLEFEFDIKVSLDIAQRVPLKFFISILSPEPSSHADTIPSTMRCPSSLHKHRDVNIDLSLCPKVHL